MAEKLGLASIAFPAISTGIFGFPKERAAGVILSAIQETLEQKSTSVTQVRLTLYDQPTIEAFIQVWEDKGL